MNLLRSTPALAMLCALGACGGGGSAASAPGATSYSFITPVLHEQRMYSSTLVDTSSNTINQSYRETVTQVNGDGSYSLLTDDPSNNVVTSNGTDFSYYPTTLNFDASAHLLASAKIQSGAASVNCSFSPRGNGPSYPLQVGASWQSSSTEVCQVGGAGQNSSASGTVVGVESLTVPAGTFSAIRLDTTTVVTMLDGAIATETLSAWRDVASSRVLKSVLGVAYSGTPSTADRLVTKTVLLQSVH